MLRRMCKVCRQARPLVYENRELTGEAILKIKTEDSIITVLRCKTCKHTWAYRKSKKVSV